MIFLRILTGLKKRLMGFHEELEGLCHWPDENKKPCRRPCPLVDIHGVPMFFCSEHMGEARNWVKRVKAGTKKRKGTLVLKDVTRPNAKLPTSVY